MVKMEFRPKFCLARLLILFLLCELLGDRFSALRYVLVLLRAEKHAAGFLPLIFTEHTGQFCRLLVESELGVEVRVLLLVANHLCQLHILALEHIVSIKYYLALIVGEVV